jgi:cytochrome c oxidase subunit 1
MSSAGASILGVGYVIPLIYLAWAWKKGPRAPQNPWGAKGLEWEKSPSPPPTFNFDTPPTVTEPPYNYSGEPEREEPLAGEQRGDRRA